MTFHAFINTLFEESHMTLRGLLSHAIHPGWKTGTDVPPVPSDPSPDPTIDRWAVTDRTFGIAYLFDTRAQAVRFAAKVAEPGLLVLPASEVME